jgi:predicted transcriptional regulator
MESYKRCNGLKSLTWKKNRSHFEIIASLLEVVSGEKASRYSLMKHIGSNTAEVTKYIESLSEIGLIEADMQGNRVLYSASEKGLDFLRQYNTLLGML